LGIISGPAAEASDQVAKPEPEVEPASAPPRREAHAKEAAVAAQSEEPETQTSVPNEDLPPAIPVETAGAVLLHPFLSGLFGAVGLLDESGQFIGPAAQARAVLLLHFVATEREEAAEPDLPLFKLLCGMDFAAIVPRRFEPTDLERREAEALLAAAIAHWDALGDVSPAALREAFLQRPGRLQRTDEDWRLTVESRGLDVLLDRLPWSISLVLTRFMARPLRVDWR
jgi:hypothetical protein